DGIRDRTVTGVQTCALPILLIRTIRCRTIFSDAGPADTRWQKSELSRELLLLLGGFHVCQVLGIQTQRFVDHYIGGRALEKGFGDRKRVGAGREWAQRAAGG